MKENWPKISLSKICRPKQWQTISQEKLLTDGFPVYGANGKIGFYSEYNHEHPTILITCRGATCGTINICEPKSYVTGNAMALDDLDQDKVDFKYIYHHLKSRGFADVISGSAQPQITRQGLEKVNVIVPPLPEQRRIASILDKADSLRRKRAETIKLLDQFLRSVFLEMFGDPVRNEKGWEVGTIRDVADKAEYGSSKPAHKSEGEYPMLRMGNITYEGYWDLSDLKYINLEENELPKYLTKKGDLLFNRTNSKELVGKTAVFEEDEPMAIAGYLIRVRFNKRANPYYVSGYLNSTHGKKTLMEMCKSIVGMANINAQELQNIKIFIPPITLQNKYAQIVGETRSKIVMLMNILKTNDELFNSLIQRAFRGEL